MCKIWTCDVATTCGQEKYIHVYTIWFCPDKWNIAGKTFCAFRLNFAQLKSLTFKRITSAYLVTRDIKNHNNYLWSLAVSCYSDWTMACVCVGGVTGVYMQTVIYSIYRVLHNTTSVVNNDTKRYFPSIKLNTERSAALDCCSEVRLLILVWPELRSESLTQAAVWGYCEHVLSLSDPWNSPPSPPPMSPHHWLLHIPPTDSRPPGLTAKNLEGGDVLDPTASYGKNLVVSDFLYPLFSTRNTTYFFIHVCPPAEPCPNLHKKNSPHLCPHVTSAEQPL